MTFSLHDIGAAASDAVEVEIAARKRDGARKLLRSEAEQLAKKAAGNAFVVDEQNIATLVFYVPGLLDQKVHGTETVRQSVHRIVVEKALEGWRSTIEWNVAQQHAPYDVTEVTEVLPKAIKYNRRLAGRQPEIVIEEDWIGLALLYLEDQTPDRLMELGKSDVKDVCRSLARQMDDLAWSVQDAAPGKSETACEYHKKLVELTDMLYMIYHGQIPTFDVSWPRSTK